MINESVVCIIVIFIGIWVEMFFLEIEVFIIVIICDVVVFVYIWIVKIVFCKFFSVCVWEILLVIMDICGVCVVWRWLIRIKFSYVDVDSIVKWFWRNFVIFSLYENFIFLNDVVIVVERWYYC